MKVSLFLPAIPHEKWTLALQMGVRRVITKPALELTGMLPPWDYETLARQQATFRDAGLEIDGLEGDPFDVQSIKLALPGRDEAIEKYCQMLCDMGRLGIRLICYNFMAGIGWHRTDDTIRERGGARVTGFDLETSRHQPLTEYGTVSEE